MSDARNGLANRIAITWIAMMKSIIVNGEMRFSTSFTKRNPPTADCHKLARQKSAKSGSTSTWLMALLIYRVARTTSLFVLELKDAMEGSVKR